MNRMPHRIARLVFEIGLQGRERVTPVQNRISAFAVGNLHSVVVDSLSLMAGDRNLLVFFKVELDLGKISLAHLEEDLAAGISRCLREWALRTCPTYRLGAGEPGLPAETPLQDSRTSLHLVSAGGRLLPAAESRWASLRRGGLNEAIASAIQGSGDWPQLMAIIRENHDFRSRLASEVSPELLPRLLRLLVPADGPAIAELTATLICLHDAAPLTAGDRHAFRRVLWECVLTELARYQPARFTLRSFLSAILGLLAARHSVVYSVLTTRVQRGLQQSSAHTSAVLIPPTILRALDAVVSHRPHDDPDESFRSWDNPLPALTGILGETSAARTSRASGDLAHFLQWGVLPGSTFPASSNHVESAMLDGMTAGPDEICALVRRLGKTDEVRKRISAQFSENVIHRLIVALDPVNAPWMVLTLKQLRRLHAQKPVIALRNQAFAELMWELTLEYLAVRHWHALDAGSFLRFVLQGLAARQKTSYEFLLADVALRRCSGRRAGSAGKDAGPSLFNSTIVTLLEDDVLGVRGRITRAPGFVVQPAFRHLYSDLDVLTYWLRWQKLPSWSLALAPEEVAGRIGPLLSQLPPEVRNNSGNATKTTIQFGDTTVRSESSGDARAVQIEQWLLYGVWPAGVALPRTAALADWLERQDDSAWLLALQRCGPQDRVVQRFVNHLSFAFLVKIAGLMAAPESDLVRDYLRALPVAIRQIDASFSAQGQALLGRYTLVHLLGDSASWSQAGVCAEDLAQATLQALSLRCQVSYERLLLALRLQTKGKPALQDLCQKLQARLENIPINTDPVSSNWTAGAPACVPSGFLLDRFGTRRGFSTEPVLHYLRYGSLPESGSDLSLFELRRLAGSFNEEQLAAIARSSQPWLAENQKVARRIADLFPPRAFGRFGARSDEASGQNADDKAKSEIADHWRLRLDAVAQLITTGNVPWWGAALARVPSSRWIQSLLAEAPGPLLETLRVAAKSPQAVDRLLMYVPLADLAAVIEKAAPESGGTLILYIGAGAELAEDPALSGAQRARSAHLHWRETLMFLLDENQSSAVPAEAVRTIARRVSQRLGLASDHYLQCLTRAAWRRTSGESRYVALAKMLEQMQKPAQLPSDEPLDDGASESVALERAPGAAASVIAGTTPGEPPQQQSRSDDDVPEQCSLTSQRPGTKEKFDPAGDLAFPDDATGIGRLQHLLRYGALPRTGGAHDLTRFMDDLSAQLLTHPEDYRLPMQQAAGHDLQRKRIARMFSPEVLVRLWPVLLPAHHLQAVRCLDVLHAAAVSCATSDMRERLRQTCVEELLRIAGCSQPHRWDNAVYLRQATERLVQDHTLRPAGIVEELRKSLRNQPKEIQEEFGAAVDRVDRETAVIPISPSKQAGPPAAASQPAPRSQKPSPTLPTGEPFYITNAGAILLWPFLTRYFQTLGLLKKEKNDFRSDLERTRAVYLVQYLATGKLEAPEYELLLNKVLCGLKPEQPLDAVAPVTEAEAALSTQLLHGVIANWGKLRNTSIEGLRQSFLIREGRLLRRDSDNSWSLTVSTKGYDVLLDTLPWRLSMIRLPWMTPENVLHVKWR
jgi:hypothetical protein